MHRRPYQSFDDTVPATPIASRIRALRAAMAGRGDALIVPRSDEYQGEYVPARAERLRWATGFTGSAGTAVIGRDKAVLLVDSRYTLQAKAQVDPDLFEVVQAPPPRMTDWLKDNLKRGQTVVFNPKLHSDGEIERLRAALEPHGIKLKAMPRFPLDVLWDRERNPARPAAPGGDISVQPLEHAGRTIAEKLEIVRRRLKEDRQDAVVITLPDSVSWLFNIRGTDVPHNPAVLANAIVPLTGKPELFIDPQRIVGEAKAHLKSVTVSHPADLPGRLKALRAEAKRVRIDRERASAWHVGLLGRKAAVHGEDPCILPKALKSDAELEGARQAHHRDGIAMARFLAWLDREAEKGTLTEIAAARRLEDLRAETNRLRDISFDTISGAGPHGAIVHYRVTHGTDRLLQRGELYLVDSGGQYVDGTTDITRTLAIGRPSRQMRRAYTLVLKGHIAISTARFPKGTRGVDLDPFARRALWSAGLDYGHGTGHGVGSFLSVHEGPQSISPRGMAELQPGMIVSNEPGYYKEGAFGIRIENLVVVTPPAAIPDGDVEMMGFETLTLCPYDRRLIDTELLAPEEIAWIDAYHARIAKALDRHLDKDARQWLKAATAPLQSA